MGSRPGTPAAGGAGDRGGDRLSAAARATLLTGQLARSGVPFWRQPAAPGLAANPHAGRQSTGPGGGNRGARCRLAEPGAHPRALGRAAFGTCWTRFTNAGARVQQDGARIVGVATLASIQATTLDVAWIRDGVISFGNRSAERCYRAVLTTEGPPEAFAVEADRVQPAVDAYATSFTGWHIPSRVL